jgi:hypothetical protein
VSLLSLSLSLLFNLTLTTPVLLCLTLKRCRIVRYLMFLVAYENQEHMTKETITWYTSTYFYMLTMGTAIQRPQLLVSNKKQTTLTHSHYFHCLSEHQKFQSHSRKGCLVCCIMHHVFAPSYHVCLVV